MLIWNKNSFTMGHQDYQWKHEACIYGWTDGAAHYFVDDRTQATVIEDKRIDINKLKKDEMRELLRDIFSDKVSTTILNEDKPARNDDHPTMKPLKLLARLVKNSSRQGDIVLDTFGGSGSTLITCQQLGRRCYTMEQVWYKANPSLDVTVDVEKLRAAFNSAKENPAEENLFRQLRLNQWVKQSVRWMPMDAWDKCDSAVDPDKLIGRECYAGLDLSSSTDITAFVLVFPPRSDDEKYIILPFFWVPEDTLELRVRRDHVPYDVWKKQGTIMTTEGNVIHYGYIEDFIENLGTKYNIREIAYDRWGAVQMSQNLEGLGFTIVPFGQGFKDMSPPTKELMKLVLEGRIAHGGNAPLRWMMDNIFVRTDPAGNIKPDKEKSTERIDGAVATIMALDRAIRNEGTGASVYDDRGILFI